MMGTKKNLYDMISRSREMTDYEACDYIMLPINNRQHWTAVFVDIWSKRMFYYDPLGKGIQNFSVIKSFKVFLTCSTSAVKRAIFRLEQQVL